MDEAREVAFEQWVKKLGPISGGLRVMRGMQPVVDAFNAGWDAGYHDGTIRAAIRVLDDEPFTPGQYKQARGISPPDAGQPAAAETIQTMRDEM